MTWWMILLCVAAYAMIGGVIGRIVYLRNQVTCPDCDQNNTCEDHAGDVQLAFFLWGVVALFIVPVRICMLLGDMIHGLYWGRRDREAARRAREADIA